MRALGCIINGDAGGGTDDFPEGSLIQGPSDPPIALSVQSGDPPHTDGRG